MPQFDYLPISGRWVSPTSNAARPQAAHGSRLEIRRLGWDTRIAVHAHRGASGCGTTYAVPRCRDRMVALAIAKIARKHQHPKRTLIRIGFFLGDDRVHGDEFRACRLRCWERCLRDSLERSLVRDRGVRSMDPRRPPDRCEGRPERIAAAPACWVDSQRRGRHKPRGHSPVAGVAACTFVGREGISVAVTAVSPNVRRKFRLPALVPIAIQISWDRKDANKQDLIPTHCALSDQLARRRADTYGRRNWRPHMLLLTAEDRFDDTHSGPQVGHGAR